MPFDGANYDNHVRNPVTGLPEQAWRRAIAPSRGHD